MVEQYWEIIVLIMTSVIAVLGWMNRNLDLRIKDIERQRSRDQNQQQTLQTMLDVFKSELREMTASVRAATAEARSGDQQMRASLDRNSDALMEIRNVIEINTQQFKNISETINESKRANLRQIESAQALETEVRTLKTDVEDTMERIDRRMALIEENVKKITKLVTDSDLYGLKVLAEQLYRKIQQDIHDLREYVQKKRETQEMPQLTVVKPHPVEVDTEPADNMTESDEKKEMKDDND